MCDKRWCTCLCGGGRCSHPVGVRLLNRGQSDYQAYLISPRVWTAGVPVGTPRGCWQVCSRCRRGSASFRPRPSPPELRRTARSPCWIGSPSEMCTQSTEAGERRTVKALRLKEKNGKRSRAKRRQRTRWKSTALGAFQPFLFVH